MGSSRWFLDQNIFTFFKILFAPRVTTHNLTFLNTQNRPPLLGKGHPPPQGILPLGLTQGIHFIALTSGSSWASPTSRDTSP